MKNPNPSKVVAKANKRAGKALAVFEKSANELELASHAHFDAADTYVAQADTLLDESSRSYSESVQAAEDAYQAALVAAENARSNALRTADEKAHCAAEQAEALWVKAGEVELAGFAASDQADALRSLLRV